MAVRKISQKVIVFLVAFCMMIPMTSSVFASGGELNLSIDDKNLSWNDIGAEEYQLFIESYPARSFWADDEEFSYPISKLKRDIDRLIMIGKIEKKESDYEIWIAADFWDDNPADSNEINFEYYTDKEKIEPETISNFSFDPEIQTIQWDYDSSEYTIKNYEFGILVEDVEEGTSFSWSRWPADTDYHAYYGEMLEEFVDDYAYEIDWNHQKIKLFVQAMVRIDEDEDEWDSRNYVPVARGETKAFFFKDLAPNSIRRAKITIGNATYTGKEVKPKPVVVLDGKTLVQGKDYAIDYENNINAGDEAWVEIYGRGVYTGHAYADFTINKASNKLSVQGKTAKIKSKKLKKKVQKLSVSKVLKFKNKGQGKLSFKKVSGNKKIKIDKKTGKVTVGKGLKKGTYKIKVKVKAAGDGNYKASSWKTATFKISIK